MAYSPAMRAFLAASGVVARPDDEEDAAVDPVISGYRNAQQRAMAVGLSNPSQESGGLLQSAMRVARIPFSGVYGFSTELGNVVTGRGFDLTRMGGAIERGLAGEGFGKTELLEYGDDASFIEKAFKLPPAIALDIVLDPVNWVTTGTATVAKTAVGGIAKSAGKSALDDVVRAASREAGEKLAKEAGESIVTDLAARQLRYSSGVLDDAVTGTLRRSDDVQRLAADRLGDVIGTARIAGTGRTVTAALKQELVDLGISNADDVALQIVRNLPRELRGGLGLEVPFTRLGMSLTRGGGAGTNRLGLGRAADVLNEARLGARAGIRGQSSIVTKLSGEAGQMYGDVLRGIRREPGNLLEGVNAVLRKSGTATADDLAGVVESNIRKRVVSGAHVLAADQAVRAAQEAVNAFGDEASADRILRAAFHGYDLDNALAGFSRDEDRVARLITAADEMRKIFEQAAERRGLTTQQLDDYVPRLVTTEEYNYRKATSPSRASTVGVSSPEKRRYAYEEFDEVFGDEGEVVDLVRRGLSIPEINERSGRKVFEDNPFQIMARQTDRDVRAIEAAEVARVLEQRGLLVRDPRARQETIGEVQERIRDAVSSLRAAAPQISEQAVAQSDEAAAVLRTAQDGQTVARSAGAAARQNAKDAAVAVRQQIDEADRALTQTNQEVRGLERRLKRAQAAKDITEKRRISQQLSRARKRQTKLNNDLKNARRRLRTVEKRSTEFSAQVQAEYVEISKRLRSARKSANRAQTKLDTLRTSTTASAEDITKAERAAGRAARKVTRVEQEVEEFLARTDAANVQQKMLGKVRAEREVIDALTDELAATQQRITSITDRLAVLDDRIANPTDPTTLAVADRLAQFTPEQLDEIEEIAGELQRMRTDAAHKANEVAKLRQERDELNLAAQRLLPVERQSKDSVQQAERRARRVAARAAQAQGAERELLRSVAEINAIVDDAGWEQASELFANLVRQYRRSGAPQEVVATARRGRAAAETLGRYRGQEDMFGRLSRERGLVPLRNEPGLANVPMAFDQFLAGGAIRDSLDNMYRLAGSEKGVRAALAPYLDPYMRLFKTWATVGRGPGYHVRNFIGGMINNWLIGVRSSAVKPAFRISRTIEKAQKDVNDRVAAGTLLPSKAEAEFDRILKRELSWQVGPAKASAYEVARGFLAEGVQYSRINEHIERAVSDKLLGKGFSYAERRAARTLTPETAAAVRRGGDGIADMIGAAADSKILSDNWWLRKNVWLAEEAERGMRLAAFIEGYGRYGDQVSASLFARAAHFDYQDLTETEKSLKLIVPFYTWTRNNVPFQLRQVINRPGSIRRLDAIANNLQAAFGDPDSELTPEWIQRRMGFETPIELPGGGKLALMIESPQLDLFAMFGGEGINPLRMEEIAESLGPVVKGGFETVTGRDLGTGQESDPLTFFRNLVPPAGQAMRLAGATQQDRERAATSWLSTLMGAPVATITERSRRSEARRRTEKLSPRIKDALAPYLEEGEEIDPNWLKEAGTLYTPEQVLSMIAAGQGRKGAPKERADESNLSPALRAFLAASS